jgi:predicted MFS family arabinose efflux permease
VPGALRPWPVPRLAPAGAGTPRPETAGAALRTGHQAGMTTPEDAAWRPLAWSNGAAQSAEQLALAATPIVAVLAFGAGPAEVGLLAGAQTLPYLLLSLPIGLLADRLPRRRLMLAAEALRALTLLVLALAVLAERVSLPLLAVLGFVGAVGTVGFSVAAPALLPALVAREALARANARIELARSLAFAAGPALAGALVSAAGAGTAFAVAAALSALAVAGLLRLHEPARAPAPRRHPLEDLREGAAFVWRHALLRPIAVTAVVWNLAWFVLQAAYVPYAMGALGLSAGAVGATLAAYGVGMVLGALAAGRVIARLPYGRAVLLGPLVSVAAMSAMVASLAWPHAAWAGLSFFLFGVGPILWTISSTTLRQHVTPADRLGRVGAIFLTVNGGARPLGALLGAWVGAWGGAPACLWLALAGFGLQAAVIAASPLRTLQELPR